MAELGRRWSQVAPISPAKLNIFGACKEAFLDRLEL